MRKSVIIVMITMMTMILELSQCCLETEKIGLLEIKDKLPFDSEFVSSWGSDSDCCSWEGVECNSSTGHVTRLHLYNLNSDSEWYLNASLFLIFPHLNLLGLGSNGIAGCIQNEGFERLSSTLTNLEFLDLSDNNLNNSILQSLSGLRSLKFLYLDGNRLNGTVNNKISGFERLSSTLTNLEILSLSHNNLNSSTRILQSLGAFPSLKSLYLRSNGLSGTFNISDLDGLPNLQELYLSGNELTEFVVSKGFERLSSTLNNLEILDLSDNNLNNSTRILQSLGVFPSLKSLYLGSNGLSGTLNISDLDGLPNLQELDLSGNEITEFVVSKDYRGPSNLSTLYLDSMRADEGISSLNLQSLAKLPNIKTLSLIDNNFQGQIFVKGLCELKHLQELELSNNDLTENLPWCLGNLTSLKRIDLSSNQLSGNIPAFQGLSQLKHLQELNLSNNDLTGNLPWCLGNLTSLESMDLSHNLFQIPISLTPLFNLSQLTYLDVSENIIYADTHDHNLKPKFQLEDLSLSGYGDGTEIPKFLYHQHNLQSVYISNIKMRGMFPYWLLENNTRLDSLDLSNNSLSGPLLLPNKPHLNLTILDISDNSFSGSIPSQIGEYFPSLNGLYMSRNELKGSIPDSLCKNANLFRLEMIQSNISGTIPKCIGNMTNLKVLDLSNNSISGYLPNFGASLFVVKLSKNRLQGSWNNAFYNCTHLPVLDLSHNNFSGNIPSWIGNLSQLSYLVLGHNNFQGQIPVGLCKLKQLSFLDVSHNKISSHMISCLNFIGKSNVRFSVTLDFTVKRNTYSYTLSSSYMCGIDVSCNNLRGPIPPQIGDLGNIKVLNFSHNGLTGRIPPTFSNLKEIESLDLSYNDLQGTIPHQLTQLTGLAVFNVSYNNLSGPTPDNVKQFATFDESSYKGNPFLCGWPLTKSCIDSPPSSAYGEESNDSLIDMEAFYWSFGIAYGMVLMSIVAVLCINPHWRRVWFYYVQISIDNSYYFLIDNVPFLSRFKFPRFCRRIYRCIRD